MTDTNWINNPLQTKFQEVLFELHDLKPLVSNSAKGVLHNQTDKMEELEKELFPTKPKHQQYQDWLKDCPVNYNQDSTDDDGDDEIHVVGFVVPKNKEANND